MSLIKDIENRKISYDLEKDETYFSPILVGVSGGSASGKTTLCNHISKNIASCLILSLDNYYIVLILIRDYQIQVLPKIIILIIQIVLISIF